MVGTDPFRPPGSGASGRPRRFGARIEEPLIVKDGYIPCLRNQAFESIGCNKLSGHTRARAPHPRLQWRLEGLNEAAARRRQGLRSQVAVLDLRCDKFHGDWNYTPSKAAVDILLTLFVTSPTDGV